jgi:hypothetical protein
LKGQAFLLAAFIIAFSLIIIRLSIKNPTIQEQINNIEVTMQSDTSKNLQQEIKNSVKFSIDKTETISTNVFDFANFTENRSVEHSLDFEFLFVGSLTNVSINYLNVSVINMLDKIIGASLTLSNNTNSEIQSKDMIDNSKWEANFTLNPGSNYNLTVSYNSTNEQNITIKSKNNKDIYVGFFDVTLKTPEYVYRNTTQEKYNIK